MDNEQFIKLVKSSVADYYNNRLPADLRKKQITEQDVLLPGEGFLVAAEIIHEAKDAEGKTVQWHVENVFTKEVKADHLMFDATYYMHSRVDPASSEFVLNCKYVVGLLNQHQLFDKNGSVTETWNGPHK